MRTIRRAFCCILLLIAVLPMQALAQSRPQGSAYMLEGTTVLVSLYLTDESDGLVWRAADRRYVDTSLDTAARYLMAQAESRGKSSTLLYDADDLRYTLDYEGLRKDADADQNDCFFDTVLALFYKNVPLDDLLAKYGTDSFGILCFLPIKGGSYALPYYTSSGYESEEEMAVIYIDDPDLESERESVPVFAHEILHLFGAIDLYDAFAIDGVTQEVVDYIAREHPTELMLTTYEPDGSASQTGISQELSEITLYMIGLIDDTPLLQQFPTLIRKHPASFTDQRTVEQQSIWDGMDDPATSIWDGLTVELTVEPTADPQSFWYELAS